MNAFHFGDSAAPLFGVFHPPAGAGPDLGVLLCPPVGQEYMRSHFALRQLAGQLARAGLPVLRFDYSGVGESAGASADADVDRWRDDIRVAAQELKDQAGVRKISAVGLRFGAALAATTDKVRFQDLVLWDPVVSGRAYLAGLVALHAKLLVDVDRFARRRRAAADDGLVGFPMTPALRAGIESVDLAAGVKAKAKRVVIVASEPLPAYAALRDALGADLQHVDDAGDWGNHKQFEQALLAARIVRAVAEAVGGVAA